MEDYIKTGEDKNFEYFRNDSEVLSEDGGDEPYEEIISKRNEFNVKIGDKELKIKKPSLYRLMILSKCQPEEHVLFSLYKTINNEHSQDRIKTQQVINENTQPNNPANFDILRGSKAVSFPHMTSPDNENNNINDNEMGEKNPKIEIEKIELEPSNNINNENKIISGPNENENNTVFKSKNDPLSSQMVVTGNNYINPNEPNLSENVINIPSNEGSDNEEIHFKKTISEDNILLVGLPPQAIKAKWFYLLLCLVGIGYIVLFIVGLINETVGFMFNTFIMCLIGIFLIFTGLFGFGKINKRIYDNKLLQIFTFLCLFLGILGAIVIVINEITKPFFIVSLILGILSLLFSILCLIWTMQLKNSNQKIKEKQMERLVDK